jgi:AbiV family abortive infection protein
MKDNRSKNNFLKPIIVLALTNAERFLNDAELLMDNLSFGHAFAFIILALEETSKAIYCNWAMDGFVKVDDNFFKNLRSHKIKHKVIREMKKLNILETEIDHYKRNKKRRKIPFKSLPELDLFLTKLEGSFQFKSVEAFFGELENLKHLGLYVDISRDGKATHPTIFTKEICDSYLNFVRPIFFAAKESLLQKD